MNQLYYLSELDYAQEISVPGVDWKLETDLMYGVERYVPYLDGQSVDLEIREITRCARDPFGRRITRERTRWTLVTRDGRDIGESFQTVEEAQQSAESVVMQLWMARLDSHPSFTAITTVN